MVASNPRLWGTAEVAAAHAIIAGEPGADRRADRGRRSGRMMAEAARYNVERRARQIIDINMGCPAKKVCNVLPQDPRCSSNEPLVESHHRRGRAPRSTCPSRSRSARGTDPHRTGTPLAIARIAERRRHQPRSPCTAARARCACSSDPSNTSTIRSKSRPRVTHSGDRERRHRRRPSRRTRRARLGTGADAIMIGRAAQGRPWIFREIRALPGDCGERICRRRLGRAEAREADSASTSTTTMHSTARIAGVRIARKHLGWYTKRSGRRRNAFRARKSTRRQRRSDPDLPRSADSSILLATAGRAARLSPAGRAAVGLRNADVAHFAKPVKATESATPWGGEALAA